MFGNYQEMKIFLSSPGDVLAERSIAKDIIENVGRICREPLQLYFDVIRWEDMTPTISDDQTIQEKINEKIRDCHVFILILNKRYGSVENGQEKSNTEREVEAAFNLMKHNKKIKFLAYYKELHENNDQGSQEKEVRELRKKLSEEKGVLYFPYKNCEHFKECFMHHLYDTALKFRYSSFKSSCIKKFWQFGTPERYVSKQVAILYPNMDFSYLAPTRPDSYWEKRLLPQVLYEDMQALTKIEKTLRLIGAHGFGFFPVDNPPSELKFMNRIWVCQARNKLSTMYHNKYKDKLKYYFKQPKGDGEATLYWRYSTKSDEYIEIKSPLSKYLKMQRPNSAGKSWTRDMNQVIAKDYAILSRFRAERNDQPMKEGYLHDYFISGIRGLGTWGAAHFIDRNYDVLNQFEEHEDIQILLEITYRDKRIFDVKVVSDEPEHYFKNQNSLSCIRKVISSGE